MSRRNLVRLGLAELLFDPGSGLGVRDGCDHPGHIVGRTVGRLESEPAILPLLIDANRDIVRPDAEQDRRGDQPACNGPSPWNG